VQPCTRSGSRLGSADRTSVSIGRFAGLLPEASVVRATARASKETDHRWVCSGFTSIAEVGVQCPAQDFHCGRGRSEMKAPSRGQGDPGLPAKGTVAVRKRVRRRPRTLVADGRCSFARIARAHRSRGVLEGSALGSRGQPSPQGGSTSKPGSARDLPDARGTGRESRSCGHPGGSKWVKRRDPQHPPDSMFIGPAADAKPGC
jgi:hypothetical protein